jgi:hypothetical protein
VNEDDLTQHADNGDTRSTHQAGETRFPPGNAEVVPRPEWGAERGNDDTRVGGSVMPGPPGGPPGGAGGGRPTVRVRRWVLIWLLTLLVIAVLAVVALVKLRPAAVPSAASTPAPGSSSPGPSPSTTGPSPGTTGTKPGSSGPATLSPSPTPTASPALPVPGSVTNLSALSPLGTSGIGSFANGPEQIGSTTYQNSVRFTCFDTTSDLVYDVAGYKFLNALIGVPSNATNAVGNTMTMTFFKDGATNQMGKPVTVSLDHPHPVHLNLQGVECSRFFGHRIRLPID